MPAYRAPGESGARWFSNEVYGWLRTDQRLAKVTGRQPHLLIAFAEVDRLLIRADVVVSD